MKLYYSPGACSLAPHIVAQELGLPLQLEKVTLATKKTEAGDDYFAVNPKGSVPALQLDNGDVLTEGPAISQFLADQKPGSTIAPANGTMARARLQEMLNYISTEIHKTYSPLFRPETVAETRTEREAYLRRRYGLVEKILASQPFLLGNEFTAADAYLFTVTNWARILKLDFSEFPSVLAFQKRVAERPAVKAAMAAEGLIKA